jgi:hypothetical protein
MTLLRRLIRSTTLPPACDDHQVLSTIRQLALQTAQNAIGFVMNLRADQIEAFWYFSKNPSLERPLPTCNGGQSTSKVDQVLVAVSN